MCLLMGSHARLPVKRWGWMPPMVTAAPRSRCSRVSSDGRSQALDGEPAAGSLQGWIKPLDAGMAFPGEG